MKACGLAAWVLLASAALGQTGMVEGRVVSTAGGQGVRKVQIALRGRSMEYTARTDSNGVFRVLGIEPGDYMLTADRPGWVAVPPGGTIPPPATPPGVYGITFERPGSDGVRITVRPGQQITGLVQSLTPTGVLSGRVLDTDGDPISNATVDAMQLTWTRGRKSLRRVATVLTNDRGQYRLFNLLPGRYYVSTWRSSQFGDATTRNYYPAGTNAARAAELELPPGAELGPLDIRAAPPASYSIRLRFAEGTIPTTVEGLRNAMIMPTVTPVGTEDIPSNGTTVLRFAGDVFEVANIAPGRYLVTLQRSFQADNRLFFQQYVDVVDRDVELATYFRPALEVTGKLAGAPVKVQRVELMPVEITRRGNMGALPVDGAFTVRDVMPDVYEFRVAGTEGYLKSLRLDDRELPSQRLDLTRGGGRLTITMGDDGGEIAGLAVNGEGQPVPRAAVALAPTRPVWPDLVRTAIADDNGNFRLKNIAPGLYRLFAWTSIPPGASEDPEFRAPFEGKTALVTVAPNSEQRLTVAVQ